MTHRSLQLGLSVLLGVVLGWQHLALPYKCFERMLVLQPWNGQHQQLQEVPMQLASRLRIKSLARELQLSHLAASRLLWRPLPSIDFKAKSFTRTAPQLLDTHFESLTRALSVLSQPTNRTSKHTEQLELLLRSLPHTFA